MVSLFILKQYMLINGNGDISHPDRYPDAGEQGFVVFSATGFPEVDHNFDGLKGIFRCWDSHNEKMHFMGGIFPHSCRNYRSACLC